MAWETRQRGGLYFTRSMRQGGRVVRFYGGGGDVGQMYHAQQLRQAHGRTERRERRQRQQDSDRAIWEALASPVGAFCAPVAALEAAALTLAGYRRHKRGEWRKRRRVDMANELTTAPTSAAGMTNRDLIDRAQKGEAWTMPELRARLDDGRLDLYPLASLARDKILTAFAPGDLITQEQLKRQSDTLKADLAGPHPSTLESLLAERVALAWLWMNWADCLAAQEAGNGAELERLALLDKRAALAQKRYLSAIKALAQVRRLQLPTVQINVGEKQINVAK